MIRSPRKGFGRIEVLVIIAIVVVGIALLLPATRRVGEASHRTQCVNNLKQLMIAFHEYADMGGPSSYPSTAHPDAPAEHLFPPGCIGPGATPEERLSWVVALLPYVEQSSLYQEFDLEKGYAGNLPAADKRITTFLCPAWKDTATPEAVTHGEALTDYVALSGIGDDAAKQPAGAEGNGFMGYDRLTSIATIKDGTSNTIALMETRVGLGPWVRGGSATLRGFDPANMSLAGNNAPFGGHPGGWNAGMADGSVRFVSGNVTPKTLAAAITISGGEQLGSDW